MQTPTQVTFQDMAVSESVQVKCLDEAERLERYFDRIIGCHVTITGSHRRRNGKLLEVHIHVTVPGKDLIVSQEPAGPHVGDVNQVIRDAFDRMQRQLQEHADRIRGQVKKHESDADLLFDAPAVPDRAVPIPGESRAAG